MVKSLRRHEKPTHDLGPQIYLEEPQHPPVPIVLSVSRNKTPVTVNRAAEKTWAFRNKDRYVKVYEKPSRGTGICRWIRKRRNLRRQQKELKKLQQEKIAQARLEREQEFINQIIKQEQYRQEYLKTHPEKVVKEYPVTVHKTVEKKVKRKPKIKKVRKVKVKKVRQVKATTAKPKARAKYATVNYNYARGRPISERFVDCFYRTCCQVFCCLSFILVIGFAIILFI